MDTKNSKIIDTCVLLSVETFEEIDLLYLVRLISIVNNDYKRTKGKNEEWKIGKKNYDLEKPTLK